MPNVLDNLAADIYKAADIVGREQVGIIPSVTQNSAATAQAAKGDTVRAAFTQEQTLSTTYAPSMTIPEGTDQTVDNKTMSLDNYYSIQIPYTGEDIKHLNNGAGFETVYGAQIQQAMRSIANGIEAQMGIIVKNGAGNALGTSGTAPFASNFDLIADMRKLMVDRGMPDDGMTTLVLNTLAGANLRKLTQLQKANEAGGTELLRQGILLDLMNIKFKESAGIASHTKGTGALYDVDLVAGYVAGDKTIHVDTGTGTLVAGDVLTFSGDTTKRYVVGTGFGGDGDGDIVLNSGLMAAVADGEDVALQNSYTANVAFHKSAVELATRAIAVPMGGDAAVDRMVVQDPVSGLVFNVAVYKGFQKAMIEIGVLWGAKVWKEDFVTILQG